MSGIKSKSGGGERGGGGGGGGGGRGLLSAVKFDIGCEKNLSILVIPKSPKVWKKNEKNWTGPLSLMCNEWENYKHAEQVAHKHRFPFTWTYFVVKNSLSSEKL